MTFLLLSKRDAVKFDISWLDSRLFNDLLDDQWVLKDMLTEGLIETEVVTLTRLSELLLLLHY